MSVGFENDTIIKAIKLYKSGKSIGAVSEEIGCTPGSVRGWVKKVGIDLRREKSWNKRDWDSIKSGVDE